MFAKFVKKFADAEGSSVRSFLDLYKESYSLRRSGSDRTKYASATTYVRGAPHTSELSGEDDGMNSASTRTWKRSVAFCFSAGVAFTRRSG